MALKLRRLGVRRVRPLLGGYHEWKRLGFPLVDVELPKETDGTQLATEHSA